MTFLGQSTDRYSSAPWRDPEDDTLRLECGVFGVFGAREAAAIAALGWPVIELEKQ